MIFNLFKKNKNRFKVDEELMITIFKSLRKDFDYIFQQLTEGILIGKQELNKPPYLNYTKFSLNTDVLNKYENKKGVFFQIRGIKVFDLDMATFIEIKVDIAYGLLIGYSTPSKQRVNADVTNVQTENFYITHFENDDFKILSSILDNSEIKLINQADVYEITLKGFKFYHIKDLEDGDFIGVSLNKKLYKVTHDPFEIIELEGKIADYLL